MAPPAAAALRTRTSSCPDWCVSDHHGEGPGQLDPDLHHYSDSIRAAGIIADLEQTGTSRPLMLLTNPDTHTEMRVPADQAPQLIHAIRTMTSTARHA
jgi:hypothetical protein